jgi:Flp pilus assembly protein TadG
MNKQPDTTQQSPDRRERGQSMVEFAISLVMLMILLAGIVDGGRALFTYISLRDAAQEGALYGSLDPLNEAQIRARVLNSSTFVNDIISEANIAVTFSGARCLGHGITVVVTEPDFRLVMPFLGAAIGSQTIAISAGVTDTILRPYDCPSP